MRSSSCARLALVFVGSTFAPALSAQLSAAAGISALAERRSNLAWQRAPAFRSTLRYDQRWSQVGLDGVVTGSSGGFRLDRGLMNATLAPAPLGRFRLSANSQIERFGPTPFAARTAFTLESDLSAALGAGGLWVGAAVERVRAADSLTGAPMLRLGGWRRIGNAMITISSASHEMRLGGTASSIQHVSGFDTVRTDTGVFLRPISQDRVIPGSPSRRRRWSDLELRGSWAAGRVGLDAAAGTRRGVDSLGSATWLRVSATLEVSPRLAFTAGTGTEPNRIMLGIPPARYAKFGLRVAPAALARPSLPAPVRASPAGFALRAADSGFYVVSIQVPRARTVELSGDFDAWTPIALQQARPGVWEVMLRLAPGTYRMNVRVDGDRWTAPPGTATVADEFNGTVGLVIVR